MHFDMIPFNKPYLTGDELTYLQQSHANGQLSGDGPFTLRCRTWLEEHTGASRALLTHSCTAALEMSALLMDIQPGDEIIMPSYTFVSTANAFVMRGGVPVFVDIRPDTLNLDERLVEGAITNRTRAIVPVHYAGVSCAMDELLTIAERHGLAIVEDAAQGSEATYKGRALGTIGSMGTLSFHETKNVISGEGGALLVNDTALIGRAEVIREKGTDRSRFFRGEVDKYTWQEVGSSYLPGELVAAFLWAQLQHSQAITQTRLAIWHRYHDSLADLEVRGLLRRPIVPPDCQHNAHMYYVLLPSEVDRTAFVGAMKQAGVSCVFHYVPLHSAPAGSRYGRAATSMQVTDDLSARLLRLPLWVELQQHQQEHVVQALRQCLGA
jgi:dTDP-4-amino-4,6-dideoxygalactose transaminase